MPCVYLPHAILIPFSSSCPSCSRVLFSLVALWITFHFRDEKKGIDWGRKSAGSCPDGYRIPVMHYPAWPPPVLHPSSMPPDLSHAVSISTLGTIGIAAVTWIVLGLALLTSWLDRRFTAQTLELQKEKLQRSEGVLGGSAEADAHRELGLAGTGRSAVHLSEEWYRIYGFDPENGPPAFEEYRQRTHPEDTS